MEITCRGAVLANLQVKDPVHIKHISTGITRATYEVNLLLLLLVQLL